MFIRFNRHAALVISAVFAYSSLSFAQAPIVDASEDRYSSSQETNNERTTGAASGNQNLGSAQGELFNQIQLLQQEVMQLRGAVEAQANTIKKMKAQNMERYIDLDRRLGELASNPGSGGASTTTSAQSAQTTTGGRITKALPGEKSRYNAAYNLVTSKRFSEALDAFKQFLIDYPDGRYAPNSLYWLGELHQVVSPQDLESSRQAFTQLLDQYPSHTKAADAMYKLGKVYYQKGNSEKSQEWMKRVIAEYGNGVNAAADKARQFLSTKF